MDWTSIIQTILIVALPAILTFIFGKLGIDQIKWQKYRKLWELARDGVYWAKDAFPDNSGAQKLAAVVAYVQNALVEAGYEVASPEVEKAVRSAYQQMKAGVVVDIAKN